MTRSYVITFALAGLILGTIGCTNKTEQQSSDLSEKSEPEKKLQTSDQDQTLTLPASTEIRVNLTSTVQTNTNQIGDHLSGALAAPVVSNGSEVIPEGVRADIVVTKLTRAGTLKTPPVIAITLTGLTLPDGNKIAVQTNQVSERGRSHTKREEGMIGGGAAAGAIVGGLLGKTKGAVVGGLAGAAAGTGAAAATGRQNLVFASGTTVTFILQQPLNITVAAN